MTASLCGMGIWAAVQDHSGCKRSIRWHDFTPLEWRNSVGVETFRWLEVTPVPCSHSSATESLRWHEMTPRVKDNSYGLETVAYFDGLG
jgi:hypothetical protein